MNRVKTHRTIALMAAVAAITAWGTPVDESTAWAAASRFVQTSTIARQSLPDRTATSIQVRGHLWVVALSPSGHILVSGSDRATPIIGFSTNNFAEGDENSPERAALDATDAAVVTAEADATKPRHKRWDRLLAGADVGAGKKAQPRLTTIQCRIRGLQRMCLGYQRALWISLPRWALLMVKTSIGNAMCLG